MLSIRYSLRRELKDAAMSPFCPVTSWHYVELNMRNKYRKRTKDIESLMQNDKIISTNCPMPFQREAEVGLLRVTNASLTG